MCILKLSSFLTLTFRHKLILFSFLLTNISNGLAQTPEQNIETPDLSQHYNSQKFETSLFSAVERQEKRNTFDRYTISSVEYVRDVTGALASTTPQGAITNAVLVKPVFDGAIHLLNENLKENIYAQQQYRYMILNQEALRDSDTYSNLSVDEKIRYLAEKDEQISNIPGKKPDLAPQVQNARQSMLMKSSVLIKDLLVQNAKFDQKAYSNLKNQYSWLQKSNINIKEGIRSANQSLQELERQIQIQTANQDTKVAFEVANMPFKNRMAYYKYQISNNPNLTDQQKQNYESYIKQHEAELNFKNALSDGANIASGLYMMTGDPELQKTAEALGLLDKSMDSFQGGGFSNAVLGMGMAMSAFKMVFAGNLKSPQQLQYESIMKAFEQINKKLNNIQFSLINLNNQLSILDAKSNLRHEEIVKKLDQVLNIANETQNDTNSLLSGPIDQCSTVANNIIRYAANSKNDAQHVYKNNTGFDGNLAFQDRANILKNISHTEHSFTKHDPRILLEFSDQIQACIGQYEQIIFPESSIYRGFNAANSKSNRQSNRYLNNTLSDNDIHKMLEHLFSQYSDLYANIDLDTLARMYASMPKNFNHLIKIENVFHKKFNNYYFKKSYACSPKDKYAYFPVMRSEFFYVQKKDCADESLLSSLYTVNSLKSVLNHSLVNNFVIHASYIYNLKDFLHIDKNEYYKKIKNPSYEMNLTNYTEYLKLRNNESAKAIMRNYVDKTGALLNLSFKQQILSSGIPFFRLFYKVLNTDVSKLDVNMQNKIINEKKMIADILSSDLLMAHNFSNYFVQKTLTDNKKTYLWYEVVHNNNSKSFSTLLPNLKLSYMPSGNKVAEVLRLNIKLSLSEKYINVINDQEVISNIENSLDLNICTKLRKTNCSSLVPFVSLEDKSFYFELPMPRTLINAEIVYKQDIYETIYAADSFVQFFINREEYRNLEVNSVNSNAI